MCTVTFIPARDKMYLTSNRDEKSWRKQALAPRFYTHNDVQLIYPRDEDAGGSWIAVNNIGNAAVLLNGAFVKHTPSSSYRKSRGLIFLDIIKSTKPVKGFLNIDLNNIEPFTLLLLEKNNLYECRWDGNKKYCRQLTVHQPRIWSSATLYADEIIKKREQWFSSWIETNVHPQHDEILNFHRFTGDGNKHTDLLMNRENMIYTVSITSLELNGNNGLMHYLDLKDKQMHHAKIEFANAGSLQYEYNA